METLKKTVNQVLLISLLAVIGMTFIITISYPIMKQQVKDVIDYHKAPVKDSVCCIDTIYLDTFCGETCFLYQWRRKGYPKYPYKELDSPKLVPISKIK